MSTKPWFWNAGFASPPRRRIPLPDFLKVPTVADLAKQTALEQKAPSTRSSGLFHALLLSRPEPLFEDASEHPGKYDERVLPLTRELVSTRREPTDEERALLDAAVLDFVRSQPEAPPPPKTVPRSATRPVEEERRPPETDVAYTAPEQEAAIPRGQVRAFWWL